MGGSANSHTRLANSIVGPAKADTCRRICGSTALDLRPTFGDADCLVVFMGGMVNEGMTNDK